MTKILFITLLILGHLQSPSVYSQPPGRESIKIMNKYLQLGIGPDTINPCQKENLDRRLSLVSSEKCNRDIQKTFRSTQRFSVYSLFHRDRPFNVCTEKLDLADEELQAVKIALSKKSHRDGLYQHFAFQCQEALGTDDDDYHFQSAMLQAAHNLRQKQLESIALQSMKGLNNLDNILGRDLVEKEIHCNDNISGLVKKSCENFKSCPKRRGRIAFQAKMTLDTLETSFELEKLIDKTKTEIYQIRAQHFGPGPQRNEKLDQLEIILEDLKSNKEDILSTIPWVQGKRFQKDYHKFKKRIKKITQSDGDPYLKKAHRHSLMSDIGHTMVKQFRADRKELLKRFDDANQAISCLDQKKNCNKFDDIIAMSPPLNLEEYENDDNPSTINAYKLLKANQCIDRKSKSVNTYRNVAIDVASIGAGFLMGGVGGFVRLASVAGRMYVRGNRIRGLASAAVLGLEGASLTKQGSDALKSCSMARRNLTNFDKAETAVSCEGDDLQMTVTNNYNQCLKDIAFLSVGALAGIAPDIAKGLRRTSLALKEQPENIKRVSKIVDDLGLEDELSPRVIETMTNMGIRGNRPSGIKKIYQNLTTKIGRASSKVADESDEVVAVKSLLSKYSSRLKSTTPNSPEALKLEKEIETTLVYFNQLSAKKQKLFLKTFSPPSHFSVKGADPGMLKLQTAKLEKSYLKAQERMRKIEEKAYHSAKKRYIKEGHSESVAHQRATDDALQTRRSSQERIFGCRANKMTEQHRRGAKLFTNFTVGFGLSTTAATFTLANNDRPKDFEFYTDLTYELSLAVILSKIGAKIQSKPSSTLLGRYGQATAVGSTVGGLDALIFSSVYGISEDEVEDQIQRIQNSPDQMKALKKYEKYLEEEKILERIEASLMAQFEYSLEAPETKEYYNQTEITIGESTFSGPLNAVSLQDPQLKEQIRQAVLRQFYDDAKGVYGTGNLMADKYLYDRGYNALVGIPRNMVAGYMTYATLCRNADRPIRGLTQAMGIQAINQSVGGYLYYDLRKDFVGR